MRKLILPLAGAFALAGCSGASDTRTISGQLDVSTLHLSNPYVVALSSAGRVFRAPIATNGTFRITLPAHASYSLRFANGTAAAGRYDTFAVLAVRKVGGSSHWFTLTPGASISIGQVGKVSTNSSGLGTASTGADDGAEGADTEQEQEDDSAQACDLSGGSDETDLESEHDLNDDVDSDHDGTPDSMESASSDHRADCGSKSDDGEDCKLSDSDEQELDSDAEQACTTGGGTTTPVPGLVK
jgi:hypothetical protein